MDKNTAIISALRNSSVDSKGNAYGLKFCMIFSEDIETETVKEIFDSSWNAVEAELQGSHDFFCTGHGFCWDDFGEDDGEGLLNEIIRHTEGKGIHIIQV